MDEPIIAISFEVEPGTDSEAAARDVRDRIAGLDAVREADAVVDDMRMTGAEVVAVIAVSVVVVRGVRELATEINALLPEIARVVRNIRGLKSGYVEVAGERVPLAEIGEKEAEELAG